MELITPGIGLIFWTGIVFLGLFLILRKYAWPVILKMLKERESFISESLSAAKEANVQLENIQQTADKILKEAYEEREQMLREARQLKESVLEESRMQAKEEYDKMIRSAKESIQYEKLSVITDIKNEIAAFSIVIAEKVLDDELQNLDRQEALISKTLEDIRFN